MDVPSKYDYRVVQIAKIEKSCFICVVSALNLAVTLINETFLL